MCRRSDSGVTPRCRYRQSDWSCTVCGASFTRKYNADRHVRNVHSGEGNIQTLRNKRISSGLEGPSFLNFQSNFFLPGRKARQLLDEQSTIEQERILSLVNRHSGYPFVNLAGRVCKDCLKIVLEGVITNSIQTTIIPKHRCKPAWLFDQPFLLNYRHLAEKYIEGKIGGIILSILCRHNEKFVSVYANEENQLTNTRKNQGYADLLKALSNTKEMKETLEQLKAVLVDEEKDIMVDIEKNYVTISTSEFPWCVQFHDAREARINKEDALMFLDVTNRTHAKCRILHGGGARYFLLQCY